MNKCELKKECEECHQDYGRRVQTDARGRKSYQSKRSFDDSKYCCNACRVEAERKRRIKNEAATKQAKLEQAIALENAIQAFVYARISLQ